MLVIGVLKTSYTVKIHFAYLPLKNIQESKESVNVREVPLSILEILCLEFL